MHFEILAKAATQEDIEKYGTDRIFYAYGMVQDGKDTQNEVIDFNNAWSQTEIWYDNGAPINDMHSNLVVGKGLAIEKTKKDGKPAIYQVNSINKGNEYLDEVWLAVQKKSQVLKREGMSMGGLKKSFHTECDDLTCWKHWDEFFIMEYSVVDKPASRGAVILGTFQKNDTGEIIINRFDGFKTFEELNLTGKKKDEKLKKGADCKECPTEEEIKQAQEVLKKAEQAKQGSEKDSDNDSNSKGSNAGSDSDTSADNTDSQGEVVISGEEFAKGILEQVNTQVNETLTTFQKSMTEQVSKSITDGFQELMKNFGAPKEEPKEDKETKIVPLIKVDFSKLTKISSTEKPPASDSQNELKKNDELAKKLPTWQNRLQPATS